MVQLRAVATQPSPAAETLSASWRALRERYSVLLVDQLGLDGPLRQVSVHALQGGKRLRPMLAELLGRSLSAPQAAVVQVATAVEYLHTASLLLDDLPCMDNAAERRGVPTAHVHFSEAQAILAAVALVSRSYAILLRSKVDDSGALALLACETVANTMAPGQAQELAHDVTRSPEMIEHIHDQKTASLFALLGRLVAAVAGATTDVTEKVVAFATLLGHAYQVIDDIEDRDDPGEARANLARAIDVDVATADAHDRLARARRSIADVDATGELGALVGWLEQRLDART